MRETQQGLQRRLGELEAARGREAEGLSLAELEAAQAKKELEAHCGELERSNREFMAAVTHPSVRSGSVTHTCSYSRIPHGASGDPEKQHHQRASSRTRRARS